MGTTNIFRIFKLFKRKEKLRRNRARLMRNAARPVNDGNRTDTVESMTVKFGEITDRIDNTCD